VGTFSKLFGSLLALVYHCFDRVVIQGYLPLLTREEHIVHFFRDVHKIYPITKDALRQRTTEYQQWVEAFARKQRIPIEWPDDKKLKAKGLKREDYVRPYCERMIHRNRFGVYFILKSMEQGPTFRSLEPKYPTEDPNYRILKRHRTRYTHYYFYIRDEVLGPLIVCVGSFLPFQTTYYLNGHHFIEGELRRQGVRFRKDDNAFLWVSDQKALQAAADGLSASIIRWRLEYWTSIVGPKFSKEDRSAICLRRDYSLNQIEYCRSVPRNRSRVMCPSGICGARVGWLHWRGGARSPGHISANVLTGTPAMPREPDRLARPAWDLARPGRWLVARTAEGPPPLRAQ
jgi:hypothetical protein